jgi:hypothetical protein
MASNEHQDKATSMPSREEIIALLKEGKGMARVWQTLREKYGPSKGTYGSYVYSVIMAHNTAAHAKHDGATNNRTDTALNDNTELSKARLSTETGVKPDQHEGIVLSAYDYAEIWLELMRLRSLVIQLATHAGLVVIG